MSSIRSSTRDRHYRLRLCGDIFWKDSFTTLHSAHEFNRSPTRKVEFRAPAWMVRDGAMALDPAQFRSQGGSRPGNRNASPAAASRTGTARYASLISINRPSPAMVSATARCWAWRYRGFGGSNWFVLENAGALQARASGQHRRQPPCQLPGHRPRAISPPTPEEIARYQARVRRRLCAASRMPCRSRRRTATSPSALRPMPPIPASRICRLDFFDAAGEHLGRYPAHQGQGRVRSLPTRW